MFHPRELTQWLRIIRNRPAPEPLDERAFWSLYEAAGEPLTEPPQGLAARGPVSLLVVVTTFQRPEACAALLTRLRAAITEGVPTGRTVVLVLNDRGERDYAEARATGRSLFGDQLIWLDARARLGKPGFWRTYQTAFLAARALAPEQALFVQDDIAFEPSLLVEAHARLARCRANGRSPRVLNLFSCDDDERFGRWIIFPRRALGGGLRLTQWFDLNAFMVDRGFFELLDYKMIPIDQNRWRRQRSVSSGVGQQLTIRLFRRGDVVQAVPSLVEHGALESEMNAEARRRRGLDNRVTSGRRRADGAR